jgi:hypothetical protein
VQVGIQKLNAQEAVTQRALVFYGQRRAGETLNCIRNKLECGLPPFLSSRSDGAASQSEEMGLEGAAQCIHIQASECTVEPSNPERLVSLLIEELNLSKFPIER